MEIIKLVQEIKSERNLTLDISKGMAIVLIVFGHLDIDTLPCYFVHLFHVPFFFAISGYLFKDKYIKNIKTMCEFITKRFKRLCIPFLFCNVICLFLHNMFLKMNLYTTNPLFLEGDFGNHFGLNAPEYNGQSILGKFLLTLLFARQELIVGPTWFLKVLFFVSLIFIIISYISKKMTKLFKNFYFSIELYRMVCILILVLLGFLLSIYNKSNTWMFGSILSSLLPFYIGHLYAKYIKVINLNICFFYINLAILLFVNISLSNKINLSSNFYYNPILLMLLTMSGFIMLLSLSNFINKYCIKKINEQIIKLGQNTMPILCLHLLAFKLVTLIQVIIFKLPDYRLASYFTYRTDSCWWIVYLIVGLYVPIFVKKVFNKCQTLQFNR